MQSSVRIYNMVSFSLQALYRVNQNQLCARWQPGLLWQGCKASEWLGELSDKCTVVIYLEGIVYNDVMNVRLNF